MLHHTGPGKLTLWLGAEQHTCDLFSYLPSKTLCGMSSGHTVLLCLGCLGGLVPVLCSASELHSNQLTVTLGLSRKGRDRASASGRRGKHCEDPVAPCRVCSSVLISTRAIFHRREGKETHV